MVGPPGSTSIRLRRALRVPQLLDVVVFIEALREGDARIDDDQHIFVLGGRGEDVGRNF